MAARARAAAHPAEGRAGGGRGGAGARGGAGGGGQVPAVSVPLVQATGEPFDVGYQHGAARAQALHAFIDDALCRVNHLASSPVSLESPGPALAAYGSAIAAATPRLSEEID